MLLLVAFQVGRSAFVNLRNVEKLFESLFPYERAKSNPAELFFVPLQAGANATFRFLGQLAFTF